MQEEKNESIKNYNLLKPWETLDPWQINYINSTGNNFLLCGRQSGKSAAMSIKIAECAVKETDGGDYLVIAFTEKQAYALFYKVLRYLEQKHPDKIAYGRDKPTMHEINIKIKGKKDYLTINCHAAGLSGDGLRHYTLKKLFIDEAAPMNYAVWTAVEPMISITKGTVDMSSTPRGKSGFFYDCSKRDDFKKFYVSAEDCPRHDPKFLELKRKDMTKLAYAQEYLAVFLDELRQFFKTELIMKCMTLQQGSSLLFPAGQTFLGVDVAGMGKDVSAFFSLQKRKERVIQIDMETTEKTRIPETVNLIKQKDKQYGYSKIYIDDGGMGVGIYDTLLFDNQTRRKIIAINNASRSLDAEEKGEDKKILKTDLYNNLLKLMEFGQIDLKDDPEILLSLKSVQAEYVNGKLVIWGNDTHITEALVRAAWCMRDKHLNIWIEFQ